MMPTGPASPALLGPQEQVQTPQCGEQYGRVGSERPGSDMSQIPKFLVMISSSTGWLCRS